MKKMKLVAVFAALVSAFTFSSCLSDGESGTNPDGISYVVVKEYLGETYLACDDGLTLIPVSSSVLSPLKQTTGAYVKRAIISYKLAEGEIFSTDKTTYKISQIVAASGLNSKTFTNRPDTLKNDYSLVSLEAPRDYGTKVWAKNGYINVPFTFKTNTTLSMNDFHMYAYDAKGDTLYTTFRQTKGAENTSTQGEGLVSFSLPFNSEYYNLLEAVNDSIVIKVSAKGENTTLVKTVKYKYFER